MASILATAVPKSDQLNAEDLLTGPITARIISAELKDTPEQPLHIHLEGYKGRAYKPSKGMRRVLAFAFDDNHENLAGKWITLYNDTSVKFGKDNTGGIRIDRLSGIEDEFTLMLTVTRGKRAGHTVTPIREYPAEQFTAQLPKMQAAIASGKSTVEQIISYCLRTGYLTYEQKQALMQRP